MANSPICCMYFFVLLTLHIWFMSHLIKNERLQINLHSAVTFQDEFPGFCTSKNICFVGSKSISLLLLLPLIIADNLFVHIQGHREKETCLDYLWYQEKVSQKTENVIPTKGTISVHTQKASGMVFYAVWRPFKAYSSEKDFRIAALLWVRDGHFMLKLECY